MMFGLSAQYACVNFQELESDEIEVVSGGSGGGSLLGLGLAGFGALGTGLGALSSATSMWAGASTGAAYFIAGGAAILGASAAVAGGVVLVGVGAYLAFG